MKKRYMTITFLLAIFTLSLLFSFTNALADIEVCSIELFVEQTYRGASETYTSGTHNVSDTFNNKFSSIKVYGGARAILYEHKNYKGSKSTYTSDDNKLRDALRNDVSSLQVFCAEASVSPTSHSFGNLYLSARYGVTGNDRQPRRVWI